MSDASERTTVSTAALARKSPATTSAPTTTRRLTTKLGRTTKILCKEKPSLKITLLTTILIMIC